MFDKIKFQYIVKKGFNHFNEKDLKFFIDTKIQKAIENGPLLVEINLYDFLDEDSNDSNNIDIKNKMQDIIINYVKQKGYAYEIYNNCIYIIKS